MSKGNRENVGVWKRGPCKLSFLSLFIKLTANTPFIRILHLHYLFYRSAKWCLKTLRGKINNTVLLKKILQCYYVVSFALL